MTRRPAKILGLLGYWAAAAVVMVMGWALYDATARIKDSAASVDHTLQVLQKITGINESLARAEAAQRGFLLNTQERFIPERDAALARMRRDVSELLQLANDNAAQQSRLLELGPLIADRARLMRDNESVRRTLTAPLIPAGSRGQELSARIYGLTRQLEEVERRLLAERRRSQEAVYNRTLVILFGTIGVCLVGLVPAYGGYVRVSGERERARQRLFDLAENLPGALVQYRRYPDGRSAYEFLSGGVAKLRGIDREAALRNPEVVLGTILESDRPGLMRALDEGAKTLTPIEHDYRVHDPDGGIRWIRTTAAPRREADGSVLWSGHWGDVTEKRRLESELRESKEEADAANRAKSTFLATMSHEIRTPMNGVLGMLELLSLTRLDAEQRTTLEVVRQSSKSLLRIIDDILDFSKIEAGKLELRPQPASVAEIVERVRNIYAGNASSKGLLLKHYVDRRISPAVLIDPLRLQQILANFVSNALKFTAEGEIEIRADLVEHRDGEEVVRFSVDDSGIGIAPTEAARLFEPFTQAGGDTAASYGGTGLGLSICRRLATMMGGAIEMHSEVGKGTTMVLTLPMPVANISSLKTPAASTAREPSAPPRQPPPMPQAILEGTLVLIVDDHPINRMVLQRQVSALGYASQVAENGLEALDKWSAGDFAAIITDCNMPEMNGYQLARHIRECEARNRHGRTPIIACTANALGGDAEKCFEAGMDDYLAKPIELAQLEKKMARWLPLPEGSPLTARTPASPMDGSPIDRSVLAELSAGSAAMESEIILRFHAFNLVDVDTLARAVDAGNVDLLIHAAHRIKGASRTVGALALGEASERLELAGRAGDWHAIGADMRAFEREVERLNDYVKSLQA